VLTTLINPTNGPIGRIANAPKSKIYGGEVELTWSPTESFTLRQAVGYKKGEYVEFLDVDTASVVRDPVTGLFSAGVIDRGGQDQGLPKFSYNGEATYIWSVGAYDVRASFDYSFRDKLTSFFLGPDFNVSSYWLANANLTVQPKDGNWSAGLWARNLFDTKYDLTRNYFLPTSRLSAPGRPASFGVRLGYAF
jgi:outer membrane receptor protein involved in Fe transport